jgi:hypothetical protein
VKEESEGKKWRKGGSRGRKKVKEKVEEGREGSK